jgi:HEAT repeat protein
VVFAGLVLILADRVLEPRVVAVICLVLAGIATTTAMRLRKAYAEAVVEALRAGNPDVFVVDEEPFGGFCRDGVALSIATNATGDPDPSVRRVSVEILAEVGHREAHSAFIRALADDDPLVRSAGLRGLAKLGLEAGAEEQGQEMVAGLLEDGNAAVRLAAVDVVSSTNPRGAVTSLSPLLADPDPSVRATASVRLLSTPAEAEAREALGSMARSEYAEWRAEAVSAWGRTDDGISAATTALADPDPLVRRAAVSALSGRDAEAAAIALVGALRESDPFIRAEAVEGLVRAGQVSVGPLLVAASHPELEADAMRALARLDAVDRAVMSDYVERKVSLASHYATLLRILRDDGDPRVELVAHSLRYAAQQHAVDVLQVSSRAWEVEASDAVVLALQNLDARDPAQKANALETLEAMGEPKVVRPLLGVWEEPAPRPGDLITVLGRLMADPDPWVRACAAFAGRRHQELKRRTENLAGADPDTLVREAAGAQLGEEESLETLPSLAMMERIVFLRRVPLFVNLSPADLKHVAQAASEHAYSDGALIAGQGEPGDEMHVIVSGCIRVLVARGDERIEVARRTAGECVGEMAVVSRAARMASLVAEGEIRTLAIDRRRFERILRDRPEVSLAVMGVLSDRVRELHGAEPPEVRS